MKSIFEEIEIDVSRETREAFERYVELVLKWTEKINLIARSTKPQIWQRHIIDSARGYRIIRSLPGPWIDIGTGGGFPAIVIALLQRDEGNPLPLTCIESDQRKCEFLRTAGRELGLDLNVVAERIEQVTVPKAKLITCRALAPLPKLLEYVSPHLDADGRAVIYKGRDWKTEVKEARQNWVFEYEIVDTCVEEGSVIMTIGDISRE